MSCRHCQGTITVESSIEAEEDGYGLRWISAWHCVNCGHVPAAPQEAETRVPAQRTSLTANRARRVGRRPQPLVAA